MAAVWRVLGPRLGRCQKCYSFTLVISRQMNSVPASTAANKGTVPVCDKNLKPYSVNKLRSWNSKWAVPPRSKRFGKMKSAELVMDDMFITKFIRGTFPMNEEHPIIVGRKENMINITLPIMMDPIPLNFLVGYSETILSEWLGCIVTVIPSCVLPRQLL